MCIRDSCDSDFNEVERLKKVGKKINFISSAEEVSAEIYINEIKKLVNDLNKNSIKNIMLPVSAPFHCKLMNKATEVMKYEIEKLKFEPSKSILISNVTGKKMNEPSEIKRLLVEQIESRVRWRESIKFMIENGTDQFIEIGPGKVLSGLVKRIDRNIKVNAINNEEDISNIKK